MGSAGLLIVFFAGVIMVVVNELVKNKATTKVVYRYLPRDLDTYIRQQPLATVDFKDLFAGERPSKWPMLPSKKTP